MGRHFIHLAVVLLATGCGPASSQQLEAVKTVRSVLAEWALAERQAAAGHATATYRDQMRKAAREELASAQSALPQANAEQLRGLQTGSPEPDQLDRIAGALAPLEQSLERS